MMLALVVSVAENVTAPVSISLLTLSFSNAIGHPTGRSLNNTYDAEKRNYKIWRINTFMGSREIIENLEIEIALTESWFRDLFGKKEDRKPEGEMYRYTKVAPNLYFGPKPPRYFQGKLKKGVGPVYATKELSGIQNEDEYKEILERGVIYGLAEDLNLNDEADLMRAKNVKSGPDWGFDDNESKRPETLGTSEMEQVLDPLMRAGEAIHEDMQSGPVLVTCKVGQNRSAAATALALVLDGMEPRDAISHVRNAAGNHLDGVAIRNKLFENYIMSQPAGGPLIPASEIPLEKLVGEEKMNEWIIRRMIAELI